MATSRKKISIISPIYNEAENLEPLCHRISEAMKSTSVDYEILLVENGSYDESLEIIRKLRKKNARIQFVSLSRNFGHQGAILAGLSYASGHAVVSLDGDLQHPPELIPAMVRLWQEGYDVVYTTKDGRAKHDDWRFIPTRIFYWFMNLFTDVRLSYGQSDFRLLDRKVVNVINSIPERQKFLRGLIDWMGFRQTGLAYKTEARQFGESKFRLKHYVNFAIDGIFSFSTVPLRAILWLGLVVSGFCLLYVIFLLILYILNASGVIVESLPPGWTTIAVSVIFIGSVQLVALGVIGEYVARVYSQVKQRPDFILREKSGPERK
ncbi:MAG: glycosyltransferase family 2 protein [Leptospiraceae bacterium]|nr:glycosyltransferase family 2 protein [Leptospiraceae bacterium]